MKRSAGSAYLQRTTRRKVDEDFEAQGKGQPNPQGFAGIPREGNQATSRERIAGKVESLSSLHDGRRFIDGVADHRCTDVSILPVFLCQLFL